MCGLGGCGVPDECGSCEAGLKCQTADGQCVTDCTADCAGKVCGDDGCGDSCGDCAGLTCVGGTACQCVPNCAGKQCGDNGCGGECGSPCQAPLQCSDGGQCECVPNCAGRECGPDGCGGECGPECAVGTCNLGGQCQCTPSCALGSCGDNGCGGPCACEQGQTCASELCSWPVVSFAADVYPLFVNTCNGSGCHNSEGGTVTPKAMLDLVGSATAHGELVGVASPQCTPVKNLVVAYDVSASYLINKLTGVGVCLGQPMPRSPGSSGLPNPPPLSAAQIDLVRAWIGTGALDN